LEAPRRNLLTPLILLALVSFGLSVHVALLAPPLWDNDERSHAAYAIEILHGHLPTIDTPVRNDPDHYPQIAHSLHVQRDQAHRDIWTANHPPLYYLMSAPFLAGADAIDLPGAGLLAMRLLNALGMAVSVLLVGLLAAELVPSRPEVAVLAATFAAGCVTVAHLGGLILNDGLAAAASSAALLFAVRALRHGPSSRRLVGAALFGAAAASLRAPGVLAVVVATIAVLIAGRRHRRTWPRSLAMAALVGGLPAAAAGWFYIRNIELYGDVGATTALLDKFHRHSRGTLLQVAIDPDLYTAQFGELWVRRNLGWSALSYGPTIILGSAGLGLLLTALRALRRSGRGDVLPWVLLVGYALAIQVTVITFYKNGGAGHVRYLIPSLPLIGTAAAVGLLALARTGRRSRRGEWPAVAIFSLVLLAFGGVVQARSSLQILDSNRVPGLTASTVGGAVPWFALGFAGVAALALLAVLIRRCRGMLPPDRQAVYEPAAAGAEDPRFPMPGD
jgi:hypothetical protein